MNAFEERNQPQFPVVRPGEPGYESMGPLHDGSYACVAVWPDGRRGPVCYGPSGPAAVQNARMLAMNPAYAQRISGRLASP